MEAYKDSSLPIHERVTDLISHMTVKEKVGQVNQHLYGWKVYEKNDLGEIELTDYFKDHVKWGGGLGALYGLFRADPWSEVSYDNGISPEESLEVTQKVQRYIKENSRLGIPTLFVEECPHGHQGLDSISYPTNIGRGAMFNPELIEDMSKSMAEELSLKGVHIGLVSTLDLARDPRWGRTEECFSEDPYLASVYSEAVVKGFQGDLIQSDVPFTEKTVHEINRKPHQIGVVLKHLIAQGDALGGHNSGDVSLGERELFDIYSPLMDSARNAVGVMAAYNDIDGVPCHANPKLLKKALKEDRQFQGIVMADGGATDRLLVHSRDTVGKAKLALEGGVDLSLWDHAYLSIEEGVTSGRISEKELDEAVYRVLAIKFLLGLFDEEDTEKAEVDWKAKKEEWQKINLQSAKESITLVKNKDAILPLKEPGKIAVVGPNAHALYNQLGDYTSPQNNDESSTVLEGIQRRFKDSDVVYSEGCQIRSPEENIEETLDIVSDSDVIIVALGGSSTRNFGGDFLANGAVDKPEENMDTGENIDVASLELGGYQLELFRELTKLNKPIITVMIQGRPYVMEEILSDSDAVLIAWYPGQKGGEAIASIIAGDENPNGRLPISVPKSSGQLPVYYNQKLSLKKEDYFDMDGKPTLTFGEGFSYSDVSYTDLSTNLEKITSEELMDGAQIDVSVRIQNKSDIAVNEPVLLFIRKMGTPLLTRHKELVGMDKVFIEGKSEVKVTFTLSAKAFLQLDFDNKPVIYPSVTRLMIGTTEKEITIK